MKLPGYPDPYPHQEPDPQVHLHIHLNEPAQPIAEPSDAAPVAITLQASDAAPVAITFEAPPPQDRSLQLLQRIAERACGLSLAAAFIYIHFPVPFPGFGWVAWYWILAAFQMFSTLIREHWQPKAARYSYLGIVAGAAMNAAVMLNNGGQLPVVPFGSVRLKSDGVWRPIAPGDHLLFFADRFAGFSFGDFTIFAFGLVLWRVRKHYKKLGLIQ